MIAEDPLAVGGVDHRAHVHAVVERCADDERLGERHDPLLDGVVDGVLDEQAGRQHAALPAGRHQCRPAPRCGRGVEVGVGEHDVGRLAAELEHDGREVARPRPP